MNSLQKSVNKRTNKKCRSCYYWEYVNWHISNDGKCRYPFKDKPSSNTQWYELRPIPNIKKGHQITCDEYSCDLVEQAK